MDSSVSLMGRILEGKLRHSTAPSFRSYLLTSSSLHSRYYHELFLRGRPDLCVLIRRQRVKGVVRAVSEPSMEPDFYAMEACPTGSITPEVGPSAAVLANNLALLSSSMAPSSMAIMAFQEAMQPFTSRAVYSSLQSHVAQAEHTNPSVEGSCVSIDTLEQDSGSQLVSVSDYLAMMEPTPIEEMLSEGYNINTDYDYNILSMFLGGSCKKRFSHQKPTT